MNNDHQKVSKESVSIQNIEKIRTKTLFDMNWRFVVRSKYFMIKTKKEKNGFNSNENKNIIS